MRFPQKTRIPAPTLVVVLHQPNEFPKERIHLFELEDTGDTLRIVGPYSGD